MYYIFLKLNFKIKGRHSSAYLFDIIRLFLKATQLFHVFMLFVTSLDYNSDIAHFKLKMEKYSDNRINNES